MDKMLLINILAGISVLIFGLRYLRENSQKVFSDLLRNTFEYIPDNKLMAILMGIAVSILVQSSSITTIMVVGFVNVGLISLTKATAIIMGANIGTTFMSQVIAFRPFLFGYLILILGIVLLIYKRNRNIKNLSKMFIGFGLFILGINMVFINSAYLNNSLYFKSLLGTLSYLPILGIIVGILITLLIRSSTASIALLQAFAMNNLIGLKVALPVLFGCNIGTCINTLIISRKSGLTAKKTALIHFLFNLIGTVIFMFLFSPSLYIMQQLTSDPVRQVANSHTLFNVINTIIILPFINLLLFIVNKVFPGELKIEAKNLRFLDEHILAAPPVAFNQALKEVIRLSKVVMENLNTCFKAITEGGDNLIEEAKEREEIINDLSRKITKYLINLSNISLSPEVSQKITSLFHIINDLERIGDHADNIVDLAQYKKENRLVFSQVAVKEIKEMYKMLHESVAMMLNMLETADKELAKIIIEREDLIDRKEREIRANHIRRLNIGECKPESSMIFIDAVSNLERIGDHTANIAHTIIELW